MLFSVIEKVESEEWKYEEIFMCSNSERLYNS